MTFIDRVRQELTVVEDRLGSDAALLGYSSDGSDQTFVLRAPTARQARDAAYACADALMEMSTGRGLMVIDEPVITDDHDSTAPWLISLHSTCLWV